MTTTRIRLHPENETRLLSITVSDSPEQTRAVLRALADEDGETPDLTPWTSLQEWLGLSEHRVTIPFATDLADRTRPAGVRLRRDFGALLSLTRTHAILHQSTRERDGEGRIVATLEDYEAARELIAELVSAPPRAT
ncbi:MAG: hypothetical protein GY953_18960 [bacterium]|nr:hypothetical protein [bacterium]